MLHERRSRVTPVHYARRVTVTSETRSESTEGGKPVRDNPVVLPAVAFATQRLCPYLVADGSEWRSASPSRDHRCGAVAPPVPLAVAKQRRLCVTNRHAACPTFLAALDQPGRAVAHSANPTPVEPSARRRARPGGDSVTRWSIVRTAPVLLDRGMLPGAVASVVRYRSSPQFLLVVLLAVAFVAVAAARLSGGSTPLRDPTSGGSVVAVASPSPVPPSAALPSAAPATPTASPAATVAPTLPPTANTPRTYRVKRGDTLYEIARRFKTTVSTLQHLNNLGTSTTLHAGQILKLP
jgi:LysM repeat protein